MLVLAGFIVGAIAGFFAFGGQYTPDQWNTSDPEATLSAIGTEPVIGFLLGGFGRDVLVSVPRQSGKSSMALALIIWRRCRLTTSWCCTRRRTGSPPEGSCCIPGGRGSPGAHWPTGSRCSDAGEVRGLHRAPAVRAGGAAGRVPRPSAQHCAGRRGGAGSRLPRRPAARPRRLGIHRAAGRAAARVQVRPRLLQACRPGRWAAAHVAVLRPATHGREPAIREGASGKAVQKQLGHATASITLDTYGQLLPDELDALAGRLEDVRARALESRRAADVGPTVLPLREGAGR